MLCSLKWLSYLLYCYIFRQTISDKCNLLFWYPVPTLANQERELQKEGGQTGLRDSGLTAEATQIKLRRRKKEKAAAIYISVAFRLVGKHAVTWRGGRGVLTAKTDRKLAETQNAAYSAFKPQT